MLLKKNNVKFIPLTRFLASPFLFLSTMTLTTWQNLPPTYPPALKPLPSSGSFFYPSSTAKTPPPFTAALGCSHQKSELHHLLHTFTMQHKPFTTQPCSTQSCTTTSSTCTISTSSLVSHLHHQSSNPDLFLLSEPNHDTSDMEDNNNDLSAALALLVISFE